VKAPVDAAHQQVPFRAWFDRAWFDRARFDRASVDE